MDSPTAPRPVLSELLSASSGIRHGFFTREGGVSTGLYSGLNVGLGSGDDTRRVRENRNRVANWLGKPGAGLSTPHQVHSADAIVVSEPIGETRRPTADAVVTTTPGLIVGVLTADCGPVLFADPQNRVVAAAHAGWKGALTGVLENTIAAMRENGASPSSIIAELGPTIGQANYEVGPEFRDRFIDADAANGVYFLPSDREQHYRFDLPGYIMARLERAGVRASQTGTCTYGDEARFFSYRRTTHRNEPDYGRQISAIMLDD
ncbi:peptidoglycan editing factor PgeF [Oricola sp.]|uniref:peptidoglycan editing factor PgeF n=1 Tax=Oricola sp. TaxID=1979950 RepID=UPI003BACD96E